MIIPIYNTIILPNVKYHLVINTLSDEETAGINTGDKVVLLPLKEYRNRDEITADDFYSTGILGEILEVKKTPQGTLIYVDAIERVISGTVDVTEDSIEADFEKCEEDVDMSDEEQQGTIDYYKDVITSLSAYFEGGNLVAKFVTGWTEINEAVSLIAQYTGLSAENKYKVMETSSYKERCDLITDSLMKYKTSLEFHAGIAKKYNEDKGSAYKEAEIRKEIELLQKELDSMNPEAVSTEEKFLNRIRKSGMPKDTEAEVMRVFNRFKQTNPQDHEYSSMYEYLDFVTSLKWKTGRKTAVDLSNAKEILDSGHYGLKKVKERILQHIAVMTLKKKQSGSILLLVGAPGTGKTSMGQDIARALNREYVRISLGGVRDEAEIRGHRRTYVGAMPGRIMEGIKRSGSKNPVVVLDEIDKLSRDHNGDPQSALLEVLDPEQNGTFVDHYMNVPYDLSNVMFVCTANSVDTIPGPLLDRMEVIELQGYTPVEKFHIAKEHLLKKAMEGAGIKEDLIEVSDGAVKRIISEYTMESGVRGLKKQIDRLMRQCAVNILEDGDTKISVDENNVNKFLGKKVSSHDKILKHGVPGVVTGLAWTAAGGEILFIETAAMHGSGQVKITGQLGDVMKESASISISLVKSLFLTEKLDFTDKDIHIHVPEGAVPKDGPSAGVTLFTALVSLVTGIPVSNELAMTGEISLRGQVLPIGGLPEKLMAAERAGVKKVLIPLENAEDLKDVPDEILDKLQIIPVDTVEEVIYHALGIRLPYNNNTVFVNGFLNGVPKLQQLINENPISYIEAKTQGN